MVELSQQARRRWRRLVADGPLPREVHDGPVVGDDTIEPVQSFADPREIEEGTSGHQDQPESRLVRGFQRERGPRRRCGPERGESRRSRRPGRRIARVCSVGACR